MVRPRLRFSVRLIFCLTALAAIVSSTWLRRVSQQIAAVKAIASVGGKVFYQSPSPYLPKPIVELIGADYFYGVKAVILYPDDHSTADEQVRFLAGLGQLEDLTIFPEGLYKNTGPFSPKGALSDDGANYLLVHHPSLTRLCTLAGRWSDGMDEKMRSTFGRKFVADRHEDYR